MTKKFYITTAIDYVNAPPHIGHAFEKVLADALSRWHKLQKEVFFLTGVDENAQKNVEAAEKAGIKVKEFVDLNANFFLELCEKLNIKYDSFIRTTAKEHAQIVKEVVKKIINKGDIYKGTYQGLYCVGCETYYTEKDLINGKCPEHEKKPELREEEAYFFKLSKYKKELLKIIPKYVVPKSKSNEVLTRIKGELNDICISRKGAKWGIDFPDDKDYKIWVWIDALINYLTGNEGNWPADIHIIGKGINWFHSVIWPAILLSAEYKLPKTLLVHGYLNTKGKKMSKSLGNVIDPLKLTEKYSTDTIRYSLLRCSVFEDSDFSEEILISRNNNELANKLGNLISRISNLTEKYGIKKTKNNLVSKTQIKKIEKHFENYELDKAISNIFALIDKCNEYTQKQKPWETKNPKVLYELADSIKTITILLSPIIPDTCEKIAKTFNFKINYENITKPLEISKIKKSKILFKKIEFAKEENQNNKTNKLKKPEGIMSLKEVSFDDWAKLDLRVGKIIEVEDIQGADKLYKLTVDIGSENKTICAGLKEHYSQAKLKNKMIILFANLAPRKMRGIKSQGMLLAAVSDDKVVLISPEKDIEVGSKVS
ncbi:MAG: methionine--tRNA ligase [Nanoarchaeota archaeon]|nr:methionine--tRNA ligase [Nanoarchaeota archaeon]